MLSKITHTHKRVLWQCIKSFKHINVKRCRYIKKQTCQEKKMLSGRYLENSSVVKPAFSQASKIVPKIGRINSLGQPIRRNVKLTSKICSFTKESNGDLWRDLKKNVWRHWSFFSQAKVYSGVWEPSDGGHNCNLF